MYIDTHTKDTIQNSICEIFNIEVKELEDLFMKAERESYTGIYTDENKLDKILDEFIDNRMSDKNIDQILFFHLGRRINSSCNYLEGKNLFELLL